MGTSTAVRQVNLSTMGPSRRNTIGRHSIRLRGYDYSWTGAYFVTIVAQHRSPRFGHVVHGRMVMSEAGSMVYSVVADLDTWHPRVCVDVFQIMPDHIHAIIILRDAGQTTPPDATSPVGAGPRACPRDATPSPPSRRGVASSSDQHRTIHDAPNPSVTTRHDDRETTPHGILGGSAHPGCRGQARGPAPTGSSSRDATNHVVNVVARDTSSCDATYPIDNVVARSTSLRGVTHPIHGTNPHVVTLSDVVQRIKSMTTAQYRHAVINYGWPPFSGRLWQRNYYERIIRDDRALANIRRYIRANPRNWIELRRRHL
jgi:REP-associated tyrosine transposase